MPLAILVVTGIVLGSCGMVSTADTVPGARDVSAAAAFGTRHPALVMLRDPLVRKELKLTSEQATSLDAALAEVDGPLWRLRDVTPEHAKDDSRRLVEKVRGTAAELFTSGQQRRWEELQLQADGPRALSEGPVVKKLAITAGQLERIRKLLPRPATATQPAEPKRNGDLEKKVFALLTARQRQEYGRLLGAALNFSRVKKRACLVPELQGVDQWINTDPLGLKQLRGKVVLLHFWTYGCINCVHNLPYYKQWHDRLKDRGLVVLGIHTPETQGEHDPEAVRAAVRRFEIEYPVAIDNSKTIWKDWANRIWPSVYLIDRAGYVRYWWYGEMNFGGVDSTKHIQSKIEELLAEWE